jgi:ketosteroid isomerase-like protein
MPNPDFLQSFAEAFNRHDVDAILSHMTDDCVFALSAGPDRGGVQYKGRDQVRRGILNVFERYPDGQWEEPVHFVNGDRGVTQWVFRGTRPDGSRIEANGCDLFTFRDGKISVKDSYRKMLDFQ